MPDDVKRALLEREGVYETEMDRIMRMGHKKADINLPVDKPAKKLTPAEEARAKYLREINEEELRYQRSRASEKINERRRVERFGR